MVALKGLVVSAMVLYYSHHNYKQMSRAPHPPTSDVKSQPPTIRSQESLNLPYSTVHPPYLVLLLGRSCGWSWEAESAESGGGPEEVWSQLTSVTRGGGDKGVLQLHREAHRE